MVELLQKAKRVLDRILAEDSELLDLWQDSDSAEKWESSIQQLRAAVSKDVQ